MSMVAMALSGFSDDANTLWKEICATLSPQLTDPYLRAMFAFLTAEGDNYEQVLVSADWTIKYKLQMVKQNHNIWLLLRA